MLEDVVVCDSIVSVWCEGSERQVSQRHRKKRAVRIGRRSEQLAIAHLPAPVGQPGLTYYVDRVDYLGT